MRKQQLIHFIKQHPIIIKSMILYQHPDAITLNLKHGNETNWSTIISNRQINWLGLSRNPNLSCSLAFIEQHENQFDWGSDGFSRIRTLPQTEEFIEKYQDKLGFDAYELSWNTGVPWNLELLKKYKNKWNWIGLTDNQALPWSFQLIDEFYDNWNQHGALGFEGFDMSANKNLPWSIHLLDIYIGRWTSSLANNHTAWLMAVALFLDDTLIAKIIETENH